MNSLFGQRSLCEVPYYYHYYYYHHYYYYYYYYYYPLSCFFIKTNNLPPVKSLQPDVLHTPNVHFCGLGGLNLQILMPKCKRQNPEGHCAT